ncbi:synaptobrevin [Babesia ovis]|uniref:Synaptobrevin n=1 Tax=Babesia ovis TaxID=5869 RepID=A0A9W5WWM1_BABOV|nr:synaptobrevin [Babesia ovis]
MTTVVYALVSYGGNVVADYTAPYTIGGGSTQFNVNLDAVARIQISKLPTENCYGSAFILGHYFHHSVSDGLVLLCVVTSNEDSDLPRRFLTELRSSCTSQVLNNKNSRSELLARILSRLVNEYNTTTDKLRSIESNLQQTTETLRHNITSILERGEIIDSLVCKSTAIKDETLAFRRSAHRANIGVFRRVAEWIAETVTSRVFALIALVSTLTGLLYFFFFA